MARLPSASRPERRAALLLAMAILAGCSQIPSRQSSHPGKPYVGAPSSRNWFALPSDDHAQELVLYALGLLVTGYRFGGKNPEAGLDCSGMVSYIVEQVSGRKLPYNAAGIAERTRPIASHAIRPGDLVFFNTLGAGRRGHSGTPHPMSVPQQSCLNRPTHANTFRRWHRIAGRLKAEGWSRQHRFFAGAA